MNSFDFSQIFKKYIYAAHSHGGRDFDKTGEYIEHIRKNPDHNDPIYQNILNSKIIKNNFQYLIDTSTETHTRASELLEFDAKFKSAVHNTDASANDSIHTEPVGKMIMLGIEIMKESSDPFHDRGHIIRCVKYAHILFKIYKEKYNLDWGTLVLTIVWHDASRSLIDGWYYERKMLNRIGMFPFLLDFFIMKDGLTDSKKSARLFEKMCRVNGIDESIILLIKESISESIEVGVYDKGRIRDEIYSKLNSDIDLIDLYSIARYESAVRYIRENNKGSQKLFVRSVLIASLLLRINREALNFEESKVLYDFSLYNTYRFVKRFYPEDSEVGIEPYMKKYVLPKYS